MEPQHINPPEAELPDEVLIVAVGNGDSMAARELVDRLAPRLFSHALRITGDKFEAEDIVQETMLRLWKFAPDWRQDQAKVSTWCFRVLINLCTDRRRGRKQTVDIAAIPDPVSDLPDAVAQMTQADRNAALNSGLAQLPERQRQAVVLRHIEELTNPQIAEIMDISVEAVESLVARGKRALKAALKGRRQDLGYDNEA